MNRLLRLLACDEQRETAREKSVQNRFTRIHEEGFDHDTIYHYTDDQQRREECAEHLRAA